MRTLSCSRRGILAGLAAAPLLAAATTIAPSATASSGYATVILAPHQDDETIRLSAYITYMADRGDSTALITATNGAATSMRKRLGMTRSEITMIRDSEQQHAWNWLTLGRGGPITRLGFEDGQARRAAIRTAVRDRLASMTGSPEVYVATARYDDGNEYAPNARSGDRHPDHVACVQAALDLAAEGVTVRFARHPARSHIGGTHTYDPTPLQWDRIRGAIGAYAGVGQRSVPAEFDHLVRTQGRSVVTT